MSDSVEEILNSGPKVSIVGGAVALDIVTIECWKFTMERWAGVVTYYLRDEGLARLALEWAYSHHLEWVREKVGERFAELGDKAGLVKEIVWTSDKGRNCDVFKIEREVIERRILG